MKKSIIISLLLTTCALQVKGVAVDLVNWSSKYKISVSDKNGNMIQIKPKHRTKADVDQLTIHIRACDATSTTCGFRSTGDFTFKGKQVMDYNIFKDLSEGKNLFVFDAGNSFFSGLAVVPPSTSKTVKILALSNKDPKIVKIADSTTFFVAKAMPQPSAPTPSSTTQKPQTTRDQQALLKQAQTIQASEIVALSHKPSGKAAIATKVFGISATQQGGMLSFNKTELQKFYNDIKSIFKKISLRFHESSQAYQTLSPEQKQITYDANGFIAGIMDDIDRAIGKK